MSSRIVLGVDVVREERELEPRVGIRQVVELDLPEHPVDVLASPEEGRDHDEGADVVGEPLREVELGERSRRKEAGESPLHRA